MLREWREGSRIVLDANPNYRPIKFPESADPNNAALVRSMRGVTLPQIGVIELNVIEEEVTRLLQFDRGHLDYIVITAAMASSRLANSCSSRSTSREASAATSFPNRSCFRCRST